MTATSPPPAGDRPTYPRWVATYSNEAHDRTTALANEFTDAARARGDASAPRYGYSATARETAEAIVLAAQTWA